MFCGVTTGVAIRFGTPVSDGLGVAAFSAKAAELIISPIERDSMAIMILVFSIVFKVILIILGLIVFIINDLDGKNNQRKIC
jgi:hypothetical protein